MTSCEIPMPRTGSPCSPRWMRPVPFSHRTVPSGQIVRFWIEKSAPDFTAFPIVSTTDARSSG